MIDVKIYMKAKKFRKNFKLSRYFQMISIFLDGIKKLPHVIKIIQTVSKLYGYFQMIPNFLDVFRAVLIFSDDTNFPGSFKTALN